MVIKKNVSPVAHHNICSTLEAIQTDAIAKRAPAIAEHALVRIHAHNAPSKNILRTLINSPENLILIIPHEVVSPLARSDTETQDQHRTPLLA
jgi:hypothetical protein